MSSGDLNPVPLACIESTLPIEPSLQAPIHCFILTTNYFLCIICLLASSAHSKILRVVDYVLCLFQIALGSISWLHKQQNLSQSQSLHCICFLWGVSPASTLFPNSRLCCREDEPLWATGAPQLPWHVIHISLKKAVSKCPGESEGPSSDIGILRSCKHTLAHQRNHSRATPSPASYWEGSSLLPHLRRFFIIPWLPWLVRRRWRCNSEGHPQGQYKMSPTGSWGVAGGQCTGRENLSWLLCFSEGRPGCSMAWPQTTLPSPGIHLQALLEMGSLDLSGSSQTWEQRTLYQVKCDGFWCLRKDGCVAEERSRSILLNSFRFPHEVLPDLPRNIIWKP